MIAITGNTKPEIGIAKEIITVIDLYHNSTGSDLTLLSLTSMDPLMPK